MCEGDAAMELGFVLALAGRTLRCVCVSVGRNGLGPGSRIHLHKMSYGLYSYGLSDTPSQDLVTAYTVMVCIVVAYIVMALRYTFTR